MVKCEFCGYDLKTASGMCKHKKQLHPEEYSVKCQEKATISCGLCEVKVSSLVKLCSHLAEDHNRPDVVVQKQKFNNREEFEVWKKWSETEGKFHFSKNGGGATTKENRLDYYRCYRSGFFETEGEGKRAPKGFITNKVGFYCTTFANVSIDLASGVVSVEYCLHHYGHDEKMARCRIPTSVRAVIAQYVKDNRDMKWILTKIRTDFDTEDIQRKHLLKPVDIHNITRSCGLKSAEKHPSDVLSVGVWVEENKTDLFCYSPLQENNSNFMLGIQTEFQLEMLKKHGRSLVCIDATHCTTKYKLLLVTVLVVDQFGKGLPVAWLICSRENEETLKRFFSALNERVGELDTQVFMSDDAPTYINAWTSVFDTQTLNLNHLLCSWHVLKNWRKNLSNKIKDKESAALWRVLNMLLRETEESSFRSNLVKFLQHAEESFKEYYDYFTTTYCKSEKRIRNWAYFARVGSKINVNMYLEAFHKTLKHEYLNKRVNLRLDNVIEVLLIVAKRYLLDYIVNVEKLTACSNRIAETHKRHRSSATMSINDIEELKDDSGTVVSFRIKSATVSSKNYIVTWNVKDCNCSVRCQYADCSVCPDMFNCTCRDSLFRAYACKHMHLMQSYLSGNSIKENEAVRCFEEDDEFIDGRSFMDEN